MISRCSSPMPEIIVWPDSSSVCRRNDGSSAASRCSAMPIFSWSALVHTDEESGQTIISGMGELHLEIIVDRMKREFGVEANIGRPQVTYRETLRKKVTDVER